jgi:hypothetical protein
MALGHVDFEQQEFGAAGALSGDLAMQQAYLSGDAYLAFAKQAGAAPSDATKETHKAERERFKVAALSVQYGMGAASLARRLDESPARGRELINLHRQTYPRYWKWSDGVEMAAMLSGRLQATLGWTIHHVANSNPRSVRNFPLQANGSEMLRIALIDATEQGISVCAPIHDAVLIEAPEDRIDQAVAAMQESMAKASAVVLGGFRLRTSATIIRHPNRFMDPRGERFWHTVLDLIGDLTPIIGNTPTPITGEPKPLSPVIPPSSILLCSLISSNKEGPRDGLGEIPPTAGTGHATDDQKEAASGLQRSIPLRTDSVAVVNDGNGPAGSSIGSQPDPVAGSSHNQKANGATESGPVEGLQDLTSSGQASAASSGSGGTGHDQSAARSVPGSHDPELADMEAEAAAVQAEGCEMHTLDELTALRQTLTFP